MDSAQKQEQAEKAAGGVRDLIARIRDEGVHAAREEKRRLVDDARGEAATILEAAEAKAAAILAEARNRIQKEQEAGLAALRTAARDTGMQLRQGVFRAFSDHVRSMVTEHTADPEFLRSLILVVAGQASEEVLQDKELRVQIGNYLNGDGDNETRTKERETVLAAATQMLRKGVELVPADNFHGGARVQIVGEDVEIDLSDDAITGLLLSHMLPRFRSILTGEDQDS